MLLLLLIIFSPSALTKMMPSTHAIDQCYRTDAQLPPSYYVTALKMVSDYFLNISLAMRFILAKSLQFYFKNWIFNIS